MSSIQFQTELHGDASLAIPPEIVAQLPQNGRVTVVLILPDAADDDEWRRGAYEQFLRDDDPNDGAYDVYQ